MSLPNKWASFLVLKSDPLLAHHVQFQDFINSWVATSVSYTIYSRSVKNKAQVPESAS